MPTYNDGKYIEAAISSILNQTFSDIELIISNNGSADDTDEICRRYASIDGRIRYYHQPTNVGAVGNFDFVLGKAKGEYFLWAASDDYLSPNWISVLLANLNDDVLLSFGRVVNISEDDRVLREWKAVQFTNSSKLLRSISFYLSNGMEGNFVHGIFRTQYLRSVGGLRRYGWAWPITDRMLVFHLVQDGKLRATADAQLFKRTAQAGKCPGTFLPFEPAKSIVRSNFLLFATLRPIILILCLALTLPRLLIILFAQYKKIINYLVDNV